MRDTIFIALVYEDNTIGRMQFFSRLTPDRIDLPSALAAGFVWNEEEGVWVREPTESIIQRELRYSRPVKSWHIVPEGDEFETMDHKTFQDIKKFTRFTGE